MRRIFLVLALMMGVVHPFLAAAQTMVPHNWPDTVMSMGCSNVGHLYRFRETSGSTLYDSAPAYCGGITAANLTLSGTATYNNSGYDPTTPATNASIGFAPSATATASSGSANDLSFKHAGGFEVWLTPLNIQATSSYQGFGVFYKSPSSVLQASNITTAQGYSIYVASSTSTGSSSTYTVTLNLSGSVSSIAAGGGALGTLIQCFPASSIYQPIGYPEDIAVSWPGDGNPANVVMYINGVAAYCVPSNAATASWTGIYKSTVTSGGTGYSNSFAVTFTGGGCTTEPSGWTATASGGVISSIANTTNTYASWGVGCTSAPTPVLTAGGGTGGAATTTLNPGDISNSAGIVFGPVGASTLPTGQHEYIGGFASYPNGITAQQVQQHFAASDWYRGVMAASSIFSSKPSKPTPAVVTNDFCSDMDGAVQAWILQRLHQMGYINLLGVVDTEGSSYGPQYMTYLLARGGMGQVPVLQTTVTEADGGFCGGALSTVTQAASVARSSYPTPNTTLCSALAAQPNSSVVFFDGGGATTTSNLLQVASSCGGTSGASLFASKVNSYYWQAAGTTTASGSAGGYNWAVDTTSTAYVLAHWPTAVPMYVNGLSAQGNAPGMCNLYPTNSIEYASWYNWSSGHCAAGTDVRGGWDSYTVLQWLFPSWFTNSANGLFTYSSSGNTYGWASTTAGGQYLTTNSINTIPIRDFLDSMLWTDPALHATK